MVKICMVGLGSIGRRHLLNLNIILTMRKQSFMVDVLRSGGRELQDKRLNNLPEEIRKLIHKEYNSYETLPTDYDIIFITNPTAHHFISIQKLSASTKAMFIEKPLFESNEYQIEKLGLDSKRIYYVACPLRHKTIIQYVKHIIEEEKIFAIRVISSSYLPEWRKDVDYRTVYSAKHELGGGVTLDLIHEWDYLIYLFGMPEKVYHIKGKYSDLEIDTDDISIYIAKYQDKTVEVHLDYIGRKPERKLELFCKDYKIKVDLLEDTIEYLGIISKKVSFEKEDFRQQEIRYFLDMVEGKRENINSVECAKQVLEFVLKGENE